MKRRLYNWITQRLMNACPTSLLNKGHDELLRLRIRAQENLRQRQARQSPSLTQSINSHDGQRLTLSILQKDAPWLGISAPPTTIPGMLTTSEKQYYLYITQFYQGVGSVVELGPWLGLSTHYIVEGLRKNPHFSNRKMSVFDDFVWRASWMQKWLEGTAISAPANYESFQPLFTQQTQAIAEYVDVKRKKITDYDGNQALPKIAWPQTEKIELIIIDCGRSLAVNEGWWDIFSPSFIAHKTLIVMQDWQNHKCVPEVFWENTKIFTDSKQSQIELIHEVSDAGIATFLFHGQQ